MYLMLWRPPLGKAILLFDKNYDLYLIKKEFFSIMNDVVLQRLPQ